MKRSFGKIFIDIAPIFSPSEHESELGGLVLDRLTAAGFMANRDAGGNVLAVRGKGSLPLLNAHLDTCQDHIEKVRLTPQALQITDQIISAPGMQIGCDDKAGVAMILWLAEHTTLPFKALLTVREEIGQQGIQEVGPAFWEGVLWAFSLDRRGRGDIIHEYHYRRLCALEFLWTIQTVAAECGHVFEPAEGSMADTYHFPRRINAVNLSVGYHGAHGVNDHLDLDEAVETLTVVQACLRDPKRFTMNR